MKKIFFILLLAVVVLAACGQDEEVTEVNAIPVYLPGYGEVPLQDLVVTEIFEEPATVVDANLFNFEFRGNVLSLNQDMNDVLDLLGEPTGVRQTPSCAFEGYDRIFGFGAINVHTYPLGDDNFVQVISIRDDSVTTVNGIRLGDSWEDVLAAYGIDYEQNFSIYTFTRGNTTLAFFIEDGIVVEITYSLLFE